jgi:hypothetical protein
MGTRKEKLSFNSTLMNLKKLYLLVLVFGSWNTCSSQTRYAFDQANNSVYYEAVIPFENRGKADLMKEVEKFLKINDMTIRYIDEDEIYAVGTFATKYRPYFLFIYNTKEYNMIYDLKFSFKDGKFKYYANNFFLLPKTLNIKSKGWFTNNNVGGMNLGTMWSTTKIPTEIPKKAVEVHYNAGKTKEKYKLFQDMDAKIFAFEGKLKKVVSGDSKDW